MVVKSGEFTNRNDFPLRSGVPASEFGKQQEIEIGFMSGQANVTFWLEKRHVPLGLPKM